MKCPHCGGKVNATPNALFKKGDLVFWQPNGPKRLKFWGIVRSHSFKSRYGRMYYLQSDSGGMYAQESGLVLATDEQVIRYMRRRWRYSANVSRLALERTRNLMK